jgi:hypothetical protein
VVLGVCVVCMEGYRRAWKKMGKNSDTETVIEIESSTDYEYPFVSACRHRETGPMRGVGGCQQRA